MHSFVQWITVGTKATYGTFEAHSPVEGTDINHISNYKNATTIL